MGRSGTGIGLALVRNIMEDHDGCVEVRAGGRGTNFDLYFPKKRGLVPLNKEQLLQRFTSDTAGRSQSVLIIEHKKSVREPAAELLIGLGYQVMAVDDGEGAVSYLNRQRVDLIVLDMTAEQGLQGMSGQTTYEQIIFIHPDQKAVLTCNFSESDEVKKMRDLGAEKILQRPYSLKQFGEAVQQMLAL